MIEFGRNRNYRPTGGGTGTIVIDLVPDRHAPQPETFSIVVEVGSDERNGVKIMGTDSIEVPISLSNE